MAGFPLIWQGFDLISSLLMHESVQPTTQSRFQGVKQYYRCVYSPDRILDHHQAPQPCTWEIYQTLHHSKHWQKHSESGITY